MSVSDQLKAAIGKAEAKGETRYKIAQESRVDYTVLVRFLDLGTSIRLKTVDRLCDYLGLELKPKPTSRK
jgi:DNA-binding phage protein